MISLIFMAIVALACVHVLLHNIFCINTMSRRTDSFVWLFHALLSVGALWILLELTEGQPRSIGSGLLITGIAVKYLFERRRSMRHLGANHGRF